MTNPDKKTLQRLQAERDKLSRMIDSLEAKLERQGAIPTKDLTESTSMLCSAFSIGIGLILNDLSRKEKKK